MDPDGFRYEWKIESFPSQKELLYYIENMEAKGWVVHTLDITENKAVLKKSKMERLDD